MKTSTPILEQRCPSCGGLFTISAGSRKKRVQCPQCREIVSLVPPPETKGTRDTDAMGDSAAVPGWMARCELLQARIETLEQQVEALMVSPRTRPALIPERLDDVSPVPREVAESGAPRGEFSRSFQAATNDIALVVTAGDSAARRVADTLAEILARAGWSVRGVTENRAMALGCSGITLAASQTLPLQRLTGTLNALREAGFATTLQLDPERGASDTMLIVGMGTGSESGAGLES